jgi:hypothetical protein
MDDFQQKLKRLDVGLFKHVLSQSTEEDRRSLLALQSAVREEHSEFVYLEIGSYQGGSLQPFVVDPRCKRILSIDPRPYTLPDSRGTEKYPDNSTARMLQWLGQIPGADLAKIQTFEEGTDTLKPEAISVTPDLCFIDGEHTDAAALRDARFCLSVAKPDGCIAFHDANLIYGALDQFLKELQQAGRAFRPYVLPDSLFAIDLGAARYGEVEPVSGRRAENYKAYLAGMLANDWYRYAYHLPVYRFLRKIRRLMPRFRP